ncbi:MAG: hypothetical protein KC589_08795, partial [Nanoarchaeota archaeon]|nr:hypothetical protein [Nanoarchaeota archaeon]
YNCQYYKSQLLENDFDVVEKVEELQKVKNQIITDLDTTIKYRDLFDENGRIRTTGEFLGWLGSSYLSQRIKQEKEIESQLITLLPSEKYKVQLEKKNYFESNWNNYQFVFGIGILSFVIGGFGMYFNRVMEYGGREIIKSGLKKYSQRLNRKDTKNNLRQTIKGD